MTGALGGTNDNFKVDMIKASGGSGTARQNPVRWR